MIKLENVSYIYMQGGPFEKTALEDVSFSINPGEFVGVIGHTGSGKSTMIQLLNGLLKPSSGRVLIDGEDIGSKGADLRALRFKVGLVMQYPEYQLFEETVIKDICFGPLNMGLTKAEARQRAEFAANMAGLSHTLFEKSPFELSGGQKRRAAIAGILAMEPKILILDEPTAGLDPRGRDEILFKIRDMHKRMNLTVLLVSHSMEDVAKLADRILVMNGGRVEMFDVPDKVFSRSARLREIGLSVPQITNVADRLRKAGIDIPKGIYTTGDAFRALMPLLSEPLPERRENA
ncbi:MAG TPA: energy-coupling factor transporter ATPase [Candidatus Monoglobus merdigallinarum]|uniref:Energy-coupling factor transporter ATP-binding protein EcfA2 n=1 Tax=Candidatus Monoglobus merdigallinarum TaxID=2838698 RepID=A0A9D1PQB1_9FIRM|nr:energy-coupling factor transporter ATPase [Candidatus Monoglobus merdigallinarum]